MQMINRKKFYICAKSKILYCPNSRLILSVRAKAEMRSWVWIMDRRECKIQDIKGKMSE